VHRVFKIMKQKLELSEEEIEIIVKWFDYYADMCDPEDADFELIEKIRE
jgi:hypothetical protein